MSKITVSLEALKKHRSIDGASSLGLRSEHSGLLSQAPSEDGVKPLPAFRVAVRDDVPMIFKFIKELAKYEEMLSDVTATSKLLEYWLFDKQAAEVLFAITDGKEVGFALYFTNFSTFLGKAGLYLEDLFVLPEYRGYGIGKALLTELAHIAVGRGYGRMEWACLDWNEPSIDFFRSIGAVDMCDWTTYRLTGDALSNLAGL